MPVNHMKEKTGGSFFFNHLHKRNNYSEGKHTGSLLNISFEMQKNEQNLMLISSWENYIGWLKGPCKRT